MAAPGITAVACRGQAAGLILAQIRQVLDIRDGGHAPCEHVLTLLDRRLADLDAKIRELQSLRLSVAQLRNEAAVTAAETCSPDRGRRYL